MAGKTTIRVVFFVPFEFAVNLSIKSVMAYKLNTQSKVNRRTNFQSYNFVNLIVFSLIQIFSSLSLTEVKLLESDGFNYENCVSSVVRTITKIN